MLTFTIALAMWAFLRALDEDEPHPRLVGARSGCEPRRRAAAKKPDRVVFPVGAGLVYLACHAPAL